MSENANRDNVNDIVAEAAGAITRGPFSRFTAEETVSLCRAFVNVSEDPITGNNQRLNTFWTKVYAKFQELCVREGSDGAGKLKSVNSLKTKFKKSILPKVNHCLGVARSTPMASGENDDDYHTRLRDVYQIRHKKKFAYSNCLEVLKKMR